MAPAGGSVGSVGSAKAVRSALPTPQRFYSEAVRSSAVVTAKAPTAVSVTAPLLTATIELAPEAVVLMQVYVPPCGMYFCSRLVESNVLQACVWHPERVTELVLTTVTVMQDVSVLVHS